MSRRARGIRGMRINRAIVDEQRRRRPPPPRRPDPLCWLCGATLRHRKDCGCWSDPTGTRWCPGARTLHQPPPPYPPNECPDTPPGVR